MNIRCSTVYRTTVKKLGMSQGFTVTCFQHEVKNNTDRRAGYLRGEFSSRQTAVVSPHHLQKKWCTYQSQIQYITTYQSFDIRLYLLCGVASCATGDGVERRASLNVCGIQLPVQLPIFQTLIQYITRTYIIYIQYEPRTGTIYCILYKK